MGINQNHLTDRQTDRIALSNTHERNFGIDTLRILSMLMVVMYHVIGHGKIISAAKAYPEKYWVLCFLDCIVFCAVNCFALISGYVGVNSKYKLKNLALLYCRVAFYSIIIAVVFKVIRPDSVGNGSLVLSFFPFVTKQYWYFSCYAILFLFIPILNIALMKLSQKMMTFLLAAVVLVVSVLIPAFSLFISDWTGLRQGFSPWWLMILYLIGGYVRRYGMFNRVKTYVLSLKFLISVLLTLMLKAIFKWATDRFLGEAIDDSQFISYLSITVLASAVFLLLIFERLNFKSKRIIKMISFLSPLAFSVYLIHDSTLIREQFITDKFTWIADLPLYQMIFVLFAVVAGIYIVCSAIDLIREYLFRWVSLGERLSKLEDKLKQRLKKK